MPHGGEQQQSQQQHHQQHQQQQHMTEYPDAFNITRRGSALLFWKSKHGEPYADSDDGLSPTTPSAVMSLKKQDAQFHKLFPVIPLHEALVETYSCALKKDFLYHGRMFLSENWICFHSRIIHKQMQVTIPMATVRSIKKHRMVKLLPNALCLLTSDGTKYRFTSLMSRDTTYNQLHLLCKNLEGHDPAALPGPDPGLSAASRRTRPQSLLLNADDASASGWSGVGGASGRRRKSFPGLTRTPRGESHNSFCTQCDTPPQDDSPDGPADGREGRWDSNEDGSTPRGAESSGHWGRDTPRCNGHATGHQAGPGTPPAEAGPEEKKTSLFMLRVYFAVVLLLVMLSCYMAVRINLLEEMLAGIPLRPKPPLRPQRYGEL